jgi:hypothetical protein
MHFQFILLTNDNLSIIGNWSSILGLFATLILSVMGLIINNKIKEIQRKIQFDARIESLLSQLDISKSNYSKYLQDYEKAKPQIIYEISQTEVILKNIKGKISTADKKYTDINKVLDKIKYFKSCKFINEDQRKKSIGILIRSIFLKNLEISETDIWTFYSEVSALQTQLENLIEDKNIKRYE